MENFIVTAKNAPKEFEDGTQNTISELVEMNLGTEENPRPTFFKLYPHAARCLFNRLHIWINLELEEKVVIETKKLIEAGFVREEENPDWVASIVPVKKKNGQIRICVDFRDLNKACPKDEFSLPVTEIIIDHTSS